MILQIDTFDEFYSILHLEAECSKSLLTLVADNNSNNKTHLTALCQSGFTGARDSEWKWHQLSHMQICTSPETDNHAST